ncbi:MAG TPA: penicillin-binding protein 1A [Pelagibacteraceae bacterium]|jgi:penicillin-binding protein 1A|nr:penicillin-binding protein 1A [Pelagibacteraceae bacterium]
MTKFNYFFKSVPIFLKTAVKLTITIFTLGLVFVFSTLWYFSSDLPDYKILSNYKPPISSRVHSGEGQLIAEYALQKRLFIPFDSIPKKVIYSFLSAEDKNFFSHPGVDAKSITRAIIKNVKNIYSTKRLEGASTITQQVAKNFLLTNEVSVKRKIKEAILAFRIERAFSKERIMELYLNQIYLGEGTYGVAAASLEYFDKSVRDLDYDEAALLAALPKAPSKYNPYKSNKRAISRRNLVLKSLFDNSYINQIQYQDFIKKKIKLKKRKIKLLEEANFYSEEVRRIISDTYGYDNLYKGGLSIRTPLNSYYQIESLKALREGLEEYDKRHGWRGSITNVVKKDWLIDIKGLIIDKSLNWKLAKIIHIDKLSVTIETDNKEIGFIDFKNVSWVRKKSFDEFLNLNDIIYVKKIKKDQWTLKQIPKINGAIVVIDPYTGRVLAMVGGFSFKLSEFSRATQAKRQPGSAFKPFVYAAALENDFTPSTLVLDAPFVIDQGEGLKTWKPENYGKKFYGPSTLRTGLEKSRNLMTVRVAQKVGLDQISKITNNFGIYNDIPELLSVSLGAAETTLVQLTNAYCTFVNGGKKVRPIFIDRIQDRRGKTIYKSDKRKCIGCEEISYLRDEIPTIKDNREQIISPETAYQIVSMMEGVVKRGTGRKLRNLNLNLAGKTGTTNQNMDAWFLGFTSKLVIGVYVGFDEPKSLGRYETGAKVALPIFKKFVESAVKKKEARPFKIPKNISLVMVDVETGLSPNSNTKNVIYESFKLEDNFVAGLEKLHNKGKLGLSDYANERIILRFY